MTTSRRPTAAVAADVLTAGRALLAVPAAVVVWSGAWNATGIVLALSWISDFSDGRLARHAGGGRLGAFDLAADTTLGVGVLVGLGGGGHLAPWLVGMGGVFGIGYVISRNASLAMLLQAIAYAGAAWWMTHPVGWGFAVAAATVALIAVFDRRRLFGYVLPTFFGGLRPGRFLRKPGEGPSQRRN